MPKENKEILVTHIVIAPPEATPPETTLYVIWALTDKCAGAAEA